MDATDLKDLLAEDDLPPEQRGEDVAAALLQHAESDGARPRKKRKRLPKPVVAIGLGFAAGLLVGWLALGWWLFPVRWIHCRPWELDRSYQKRFVALVAAEYQATADADRARQDLAGWDPDALAALLSEMEREATSSEVRQQLIVLRNALALPEVRLSLWSSVLRQKGVLWSAGLSTLPLVAAVALAAKPRFAAWLRAPEQDEVEELSVELLASEGGNALAPWVEAMKQTLDEEEGPAAESAKDQATTDGKGKAQAAAPGDEDALEGTVHKVEEVVELAQQPVEDIAGALAELLDAPEAIDPRLELLASLIEYVDINDLLQQSEQVLAQFLMLYEYAEGCPT